MTCGPTFSRFLRNWSGAIAAILVELVRLEAQSAAPVVPDFTDLEAGLERLRVRWNIPGMAAGVSQSNRIVWVKGFGVAHRANSSLIVELPERGVTFVLLGNSEALSRKFDLGKDEDVTPSPFARVFLKCIGL